MTGFLSPTHTVLLLVVVLLLFGARRLPEFGRSLGSGMREFKHSLNHEPSEEPSRIASAAAPHAEATADNASPPRPDPDP